MQKLTLFNKIRIIRLNKAGAGMTQHIKGQGRHQVTLLPEVLDDFVTEDLIHYIRPLIQAELSPIMVDGLPRHLNVNMD